jgi:hypothetical protein
MVVSINCKTSTENKQRSVIIIFWLQTLMLVEYLKQMMHLAVSAG